MTEAARTIADTMPVVVFDDRPSAESGMTNVRARNVTLATGLDLSTSLALACHASVILAPDSAFTHLAGARNIPCVSVFGPTDGALRMSAYPRAIVVSRGKDLPCVPCWRNQSMPCMLTGGMASQCLEALPVSAVVDAVSHQIREYRLIGPVT